MNGIDALLRRNGFSANSSLPVHPEDRYPAERVAKQRGVCPKCGGRLKSSGTCSICGEDSDVPGDQATDPSRGAGQGDRARDGTPSTPVRDPGVPLRGPATNAGTCPECGGELDEDGVCEECGWDEYDYEQNAASMSAGAPPAPGAGGKKKAPRVKAAKAGSAEAQTRTQQQGTVYGTNSNPEGINQYTVHGGSGAKEDKVVSSHATRKEAQFAAVEHNRTTGEKAVVRAGRGHREYPKGTPLFTAKTYGQHTPNDKQRPTGNSSITRKEMTVPLTTNQRRGIVTVLSTNCDCWKGDAETLNGFDDAKLVKLITAYDRARQDAMVANAVKQGVETDAGTFAYDAGRGAFTVNGDMSDHKLNVVESEDEDESIETSGRKGPEGSGTGSGDDAPKATKNSRLTAEEQEDIAYARNMRQAERDRLVGRLTANIADKGQKARLTKVYNATALPVLRDMVAAQPAPVVTNDRSFDRPPGEYGSVPVEGVGGYTGNDRGVGGQSYFGAGMSLESLVGNVGNDQDSPLDLPVINYGEWAKEGADPRHVLNGAAR